MTLPAAAARSSLAGVVAVWIAAAVVAVTIGIVAPDGWRAAWMPVGMAGCLVLAFVIQLVQGHADGFLQRVAASAVGALVVMGLIGLGLGLSSLFSG
ncbi:hypothetical protein [Microbacterium sp.]|uniref:hypothetical protein n=1 Tax=Microbacterium sp. TaxID=51671 RepID=UPI0039E5566E